MYEWTLFAESYCHECKNATVFYYIYTTFLFSTKSCHNCVYVTVLELSHNATKVFYVVYATDMQTIVAIELDSLTMFMFPVLNVDIVIGST